MRTLFTWFFLFCLQLLKSRNTNLKRWVIGDCFYVLMEPTEGLINTHSMENSCSYPTEFWKTWLLSRLYCLYFIFLIYSLKGYFWSFHMTNNMPYGKKKKNKKQTGQKQQECFFNSFINPHFFKFCEWEFHFSCILVNVWFPGWCLVLY